MRITLINQFYTPDLAPTGHMAASLANHRAKSGDFVTVVTSVGGYVPESIAKATSAQSNPRVIRLWTPQLGKSRKLTRVLDYTTFYLLAALRMMLLPRQDLVISLTTPPFIAWTAILHKWLHPSTKIVLWNMDCYPEIAERTGVIREGRLLSRLLRALNKGFFRRVDGVVCLDPAMRDLLQSHYGNITPPPQFHVIPNWEPLSEFPTDLVPAPWIDAPPLEPDNPFVVLYLGNAGFGHRFETMIEVAEHLKEEPFVFLFVGGGQKWSWLAEAARSRKLKNIILRPYVAKEITPSVMALSHCALITMSETALGLISPSKLHSNLAMRLPILYIGPKGSNVDAALEEYGFGLSVQHGETDKVISFLRDLKHDPEFQARLRKAARLAFESAFCDNQTLPQFDHLISSVTA